MDRLTDRPDVTLAVYRGRKTITQQQMDEFICQIRGVWFSLFYFILKKNTQGSFANSANPNQTPRFAASDLGLYCLVFSIYGTLGIG